MTSTNPIVANAITASNASGGSSFYKAYAGKALSALREIQYEAEGRLRALSGDADAIASEAKKAGDAQGWNDIVRCQSLLEDALANYIRISKRTVG